MPMHKCIWCLKWPISTMGFAKKLRLRLTQVLLAFSEDQVLCHTVGRTMAKVLVQTRLQGKRLPKPVHRAHPRNCALVCIAPLVFCLAAQAQAHINQLINSLISSYAADHAEINASVME